jgi:hypothetical protein
MGVDEARHHELAAGIDHLIGIGRQLVAWPDGFDHAIAREHPAVGDLAPRVVHRDEHVGMTNQQCRHGQCPPSAAFAAAIASATLLLPPPLKNKLCVLRW